MEAKDQDPELGRQPATKDTGSNHRDSFDGRKETSIRDFVPSLQGSDRRRRFSGESRRSQRTEPPPHDENSLRNATPPRQSYEFPRRDTKRSLVDDLHDAINDGLYKSLGDKLDQLPLYLHRDDMFMDMKPRKRDPRKLVLSFAALSRMRMRKLQCQLIRDVVHMHFQDAEPPDWEEHLAKYVAAVRDNDFIASAFDRRQDPFIVHSERAVDAEILKMVLGSFPKSQEQWKDVDFGRALDHDNPLPIGGGTRGMMKAKERLRSFLTRMTLGVIGGAFLVGPMWLMVLHDTQITKLVSTTVFVFAFGILMSWNLSDAFSVLSATAAYAAVLVVFVGANG